MAVPTGTFETVDAIGRREDLTDDIYMIDPFETPFMSAIAAVEADGRLHEWQTQRLAAAATNQQPEGDDPTNKTVTVSVRVSNTCQISSVTAQVSGSQQAVRKAGRGDEMEYQLALAALELKRDMETDIMRNNAEVSAPASGTARELGSLDAWYETNVDRGTSGSSGTAGNTAATDGTQRAFVETQLTTVIRSCFTNGGRPDRIYVGAFNREILSTFTGNATRYIDANDKKLTTAIDIYDSNFGDLQVECDLFQRAREAHIIETRMFALAYLRPFAVERLAKTGDSERSMLIVEYTLEVRAERSSGIVADLNTA